MVLLADQEDQKNILMQALECLQDSALITSIFEKIAKAFVDGNAVLLEPNMSGYQTKGFRDLLLQKGLVSGFTLLNYACSNTDDATKMHLLLGIAKKSVPNNADEYKAFFASLLTRSSSLLHKAIATQDAETVGLLLQLMVDV